MKPFNSSTNSKLGDDHYVVIKNSSRINPLYEKPVIEVDSKPIQDVQIVVDECERIILKINKNLEDRNHTTSTPSSSSHISNTANSKTPDSHKSKHSDNNKNIPTMKKLSSIHDALQIKIQTVEKNLRKLLLGSIDKKIALRTQAKHLIARLQTCLTHSHNECTKQEIVISDLRNMIDSITKDSSHIRIMKEFNDEIVRMTTIQNTRNAGKTTFLTWSNMGNKFNSSSNSQNQNGLSSDHYTNDEDNQLLLLRLHKLHKVKEQIVVHLSNYLEVKETHSLNYNNCNNVRNELMHLIRANISSTPSSSSSGNSSYSNKRRQHDNNQDHDNETITGNESNSNCNRNEMNCDTHDNCTSIATTKTSLESSTTSSSSITLPLVVDSNNNNNISTFSNNRKSLRTSKSYDNLSSGALSIGRHVSILPTSSMDDIQTDGSLIGLESYDHSRCKDCSFSHAIASDCIDHLCLLDTQTLDASRCLKRLIEIKEKVSELNKLVGDTMIDTQDLILESSMSSSLTDIASTLDSNNDNNKIHQHNVINHHHNNNNHTQKNSNGLTTKLKNKIGSGIENIHHLNNKFAKLNPAVVNLQSSLSNYLSNAHATASSSIGTISVGVGNTVGNLSRSNSFSRLNASTSTVTPQSSSSSSPLTSVTPSSVNSPLKPSTVQK